MSQWYVYSGDSLSHYGVLGMKWGKRRGSTSSETSSKPKPKTISEMSTKEIKAANDRMRAESDYKKLTKEKNQPAKSEMQKKKEKMVKEALVEVGGRTMKSVGSDVAHYAIGSSINKILGVNVVKDVPLTKIGKYKQGKAGDKNLKKYKKSEADKAKKKQEKKDKKSKKDFEKFHLNNG